jgi:predicted DNA-binding protein
MLDIATMNDDKMISITFRVSPKDAAKLRELAGREQRTTSQYVRLLVLKYIAEQRTPKKPAK